MRLLGVVFGVVGVLAHFAAAEPAITQPALPRADVTLNPSLAKNGSLRVTFRVLPAQQERLVLTSLVLTMSRQVTVTDVSSKPHLHGWYVSVDPRALWVGVVIPAGKDVGYIDMNLPPILSRGSLSGDDYTLYISTSTGRLSSFVDGSGQKAVFAPIHCIALQHESDLTVTKAEGWEPRGVTGYVWSTEGPRAEANLRISFKSSGPIDAVIMKIVSVLGGFGNGTIITMLLLGALKTLNVIKHSPRMRFLIGVGVGIAGLTVALEFLGLIGHRDLLIGILSGSVGIAVGPRISESIIGRIQSLT